MVVFDGKIRTAPYVETEADKILENPYEIRESPEALKVFDSEWTYMKRVLQNLDDERRANQERRLQREREERECEEARLKEEARVKAEIAAKEAQERAAKEAQERAEKAAKAAKEA